MPHVDISASFDKKERPRNGLSRIAAELDEHPERRHVVVATVEAIRTTIDHKQGGARTPAVQVLNIEALDGDEAKQARAWLERRYKERTGTGLQDELPLDDEGDEDED